MIAEAIFALNLLRLTGPDGAFIEVNPNDVVSLRGPHSIAAHVHPKTHCLIFTSDGKFVSVAEDCETVEKLLKAIDNDDSLMQVHDFYAENCCGGSDCRPVPCEEISPITSGWQWRHVTFTRTMLRKSPDGGCHVCVGAEDGPRMDPIPHCIYLPPET